MSTSEQQQHVWVWQGMCGSKWMRRSQKKPGRKRGSMARQLDQYLDRLVDVLLRSRDLDLRGRGGVGLSG